MNTRQKVLILFSLLIIASMVLAACQPTAAPAPERIVETVVVEREVEVVETVEVEVEVEVPVEVIVTPEPVSIDHTGAWFDTIVVVEEPSADAAVRRMEVGDIDIYMFAIAQPDTANAIANSPALKSVTAFGNYDELSFNPAGPVFEGTGKLNPFAVATVREAMNWLVDREYISQELYGGMAAPRFFPINNASNDYALYADTAKALERKYAHNKETAEAIITSEMEALGAEKVGGLWQYEGEPVEIILLIRTEDTRRLIGDYVGVLLEDLGFTVVRDYKTAAEAGPIWLSGEPRDGLYHIYTGGWISTAVPRDLGTNFAYFYTDMGRSENMWQQYVNDPEYYEIARKLDNNDFRNMEERGELFRRALELSMLESYRVWLVDRAPVYGMRSEVIVGSDLYGGPSGSWMWQNTLRREGEVGGSFTLGTPSILTQPWNPLDGSNWIFDQMLVRGTGEAAHKPDLYTGLYWPNHFERAEVFVEEGLPVTKTLDWVSLEFVPSIPVPEDAWVDWDAAEQRFITAGELEEAPAPAAARVVVYYPDDLYETVTWHDGSAFSIGDVVMAMILTLDRGKEDSVIYDASKTPALTSFLSSFKGVRILSEDPLVIETYTDNYQLDAELNVAPGGSLVHNWWPHYSQGSGAWHNLALGVFAEEKELGTFSPTKATALEVDRFSYVAGPTVDILKAELDAAQEEGLLPYAATLSEFISADEIATRYSNLQEWHRSRGHLWIGTGPYFVQRAFPVEGTVILQRYAAYPFAADRWDRFAEPIIPLVEVEGPARVTAGSAESFDVYVTFHDEPYAVDDINEVKYLVFDATGELAYVGTADPVENGLWQVNLTSDVTGDLPEGSTLLEVVVVSKLVALPVSETITFVTSP
jgi:peptide/nickel transport system substrate-binding protein